MSDELPPEFDQAGRLPFTPAEMRAVRDAYEALTRVGNATRDIARHGVDEDGWNPQVDRAHQGIGVLLAQLAVDGVDLRPALPGPLDELIVPDDLSGLFDGRATGPGEQKLPSQIGEHGTVIVIAGIDPTPGSPYITEVQPADDVVIRLPYDKAVAYGMAVLGAAHRAHYLAAVLAQARGIIGGRGKQAPASVAAGIEAEDNARFMLGQLVQDLPELDHDATEPLRFLPYINRAGEPMIRGSLPPHTEGFTGWTFDEAVEHATAVLAQAQVSQLDTAYRTLIAVHFQAGEQRGRAAVADLGNYYQRPGNLDDEPPAGAGRGGPPPPPRVPGPAPGARAGKASKRDRKRRG